MSNAYIWSAALGLAKPSHSPHPGAALSTPVALTWIFLAQQATTPRQTPLHRSTNLMPWNSTAPPNPVCPSPQL